jgi:hypothetical protein
MPAGMSVEMMQSMMMGMPGMGMPFPMAGAVRCCMQGSPFSDQRGTGTEGQPTTWWLWFALDAPLTCYPASACRHASRVQASAAARRSSQKGLKLLAAPAVRSVCAFLPAVNTICAY